MNRPLTAIDRLCNTYVDDACAADPIMATGLGVSGHDHAVTDYSPDGVAERMALASTFLKAVQDTEPADATDVLTVHAVTERVGLELELHAAGEFHGPLNVIASPIQELRDIVELMPTETSQDWDQIIARLGSYDTAIAGYMASLRHRITHGTPPAKLQVTATLDQIERAAHATDGAFVRLVDTARPDGKPLNAAQHHALSEAARVATDAFTTLHSMISSEVLPVAREDDAVGPETYRLWSRMFLGSDVDLEETYQWGLEELARVEEEMASIASTILPGASVDEAVRHLDADPTRTIADAEAFREWMQATADEALIALSGVHFDIPAQVRAVECRFAAASTGGIYYTPPSEDFSRPGRMWWSVAPGQKSFSTWAERTTVYHEGVPGHHLQIGQTLVRSDILNRWRRMMSWTSGHGEGWALYAERLMADLGFLDDPADRLGMLCASAMRAMRVVADIGVHCGFDAPADIGGGTWDANKLWTWIKAHGRLPDGQARFEHKRYLGWPGQAPSYKVGERLWLQIRDAVAAREGDAFELRDFHRDALNVGSLGLDTLKWALVDSHEATA